MIAQSRADNAAAHNVRMAGASASASAQNDEGYWAYMQRQVQERTEKLGLVGEGMNDLEQSSSNWLEDVNKFVGKQKRGIATGCECTFRLLLLDPLLT
jgi:syntaxin-binding protein 5